MMMMFQRLDFFLFCCFLRVGSQTDVSSLLTPNFDIQLSWTKAENCTYTIKTTTAEEIIYDNETPPWTKYIVMNGGCPPLTLETICKNGTKESSPKCQELLVKDVDCYIHTSKQTVCSWRPLTRATDLHFFYRLANEGLTESMNKTHIRPLHKCSSYSYTNNARTGCTLRARSDHEIDIWFNATLNNETVKNTFKKYLWRNVKPAALNWTATKSGDKLNISWTPPDIFPQIAWQYTINYTLCGKESKPRTTSEEKYVLDLSPNCRCCVKIKAAAKYAGGTPWSDEKCFGTDRGPNPLVYAAIIIPLMLAGLAVVAIVYCKKNKEYIFPKVPVPRDLLSDISNNNNKSTVCKLYVPAEEEDNCKITLVMDPQNNKLNH